MVLIELMKVEKKITYLFGAGASYSAFPIWEEQSHAMISLANKYLKVSGPINYDEFENQAERQDRVNRLLWDIGYFGTKAKEFGTIDAYARKLHLNGLDDELDRLKIAVSAFFTLWQFSTDLEKHDFFSKNRKFSKIDQRYMSLLARILQKNVTSSCPNLPDNYNVVTWNYDLQFELAFQSFCNNSNWNDVRKELKMGDQLSESRVCHLNGYHGHYYYENKVKNHPFRYSTFDALINIIAESDRWGDSDYSDHINYAWENNSDAKITRSRAKEIFKNTDQLIIVGYSFPPFNKDIDKDLFSALDIEKVEIINQNPTENNAVFDSLIDPELGNGLVESVKETTYFYLPY